MEPLRQLQSHVESSQCLCMISLFPRYAVESHGNTVIRVFSSLFLQMSNVCVQVYLCPLCDYNQQQILCVPRPHHSLCKMSHKSRTIPVSSRFHSSVERQLKPYNLANLLCHVALFDSNCYRPTSSLCHHRSQSVSLFLSE